MSPDSNESVVRPMHPLWLIPISIVAGVVVGGPFAGAILWRCGYRKSGWNLTLGSLIIGAALLLAAGLWSVQWSWVALTLISVHAACGTILFLITLRPFKRFQVDHPPVVRERGSYRNVFSGLVGGALIGGLFGAVLSIFYVLLTDRLLSTIMPVAFNNTSGIFRAIECAIFITISGIVAGGFLGRFRPRITAGQIFVYAALLVWTHFTWMLSMDVTVLIPAFQAYSATLGSWYSVIVPVLLLELLIACWWTVFLLFFVIAAQDLFGKTLRGSLVLLVNLAAALSISITLGYSADLLLGLGNHFERSAETGKALWCYELGLRKEPKPRIASYLQYRVALLYHKMGHSEKAQRGFRRLVAKYNANEILVRKANRFLENMESRSGGKRVVLPGVETRTEYKGGYCVPNSLALVMRYWGKNISARAIGSRITGLGSGTIVVDQCWFAEQEGWRHEFLPQADIKDIKRCIDAGFPVLVYVPAHVFAILGYDDVLETFVTYDVATRDIWEEYIQKDFVKTWKKQGGTLVLVYPPEKMGQIPSDIHMRMVNLSDDYLHFQLRYFDAPRGSLSIPHLSKAAGAKGGFFLPVTVLYTEFPGLRTSVDRQIDANQIAEAIKAYFWNDFDEGIHLAGQLDDEHQTRHDWALDCAVSYLIDHEKYDLVETLIARINTQGQVSTDTLAELGLMNLSRGDFERGLDRIQKSSKSSIRFYAALAKLRTGDVRGAARDLVKDVKGKT